MNYYEILYIVHPALEGGHLQDITKSVDELLDKNGAKVKAQDNWGRKRLAYPIEKQNYGTYILTQFESDGRSNSDILKDLDHNSNILGSLISKIEQSELLSNENLKTKEAANEEAPKEEAPKAEAANEEAPKEEAAKEETPAEEENSDEKSKEED